MRLYLMIISSVFDSGNIDVVSALSNDDIQLRIRRDAHSEFFQWFHFRLFGELYQSYSLRILDLDKSAYPDGWKDYDVVASYDRQQWFRVPSEFNGTDLRFSVTLDAPCIYFAYFTPYSYERHLDLMQEAQTSPFCEHVLLGQTLDGRDMSMLVIGDASEEKRKIWITARQHPGETMAQWCAEGIIHRLLDEQDGLARDLLSKAVFYIVPNMNPDGGVRGHLRTNAAGINLNREWATPSMEKSPEVYVVKQAMETTGVDLYLDLHGDEAIPYNFVAGSEGVPGYSERLAALESSFKQALLTITPEFQVAHGYPVDAPGAANLTIASNAICHQFDCLSFTVEMPFKDSLTVPCNNEGWSSQRSRQLGEDLLSAVRTVLPKLR